MPTIRQETNEDHQVIFDVNAKAFQQKNESELIEKLRATPHFIPELSLVAVEDENIIGHILFSKIHIKTEDQNYEVLSLAPMAVLPEFQGRGIGQLLIREALKLAKDLGYQAILVLGHPKYYPKFGFEKASRWGIQCPYPAPDEAWMAMELVPGGLENKKGVAVFPDVFNEV